MQNVHTCINSHCAWTGLPPPPPPQKTQTSYVFPHSELKNPGTVLTWGYLGGEQHCAPEGLSNVDKVEGTASARDHEPPTTRLGMFSLGCSPLYSLGIVVPPSRIPTEDW